MVEFQLPPEMAQHALRFAEQGGVPVEPRLASTVVLLREPFEAYLIRRASTMAFAASMYAFPGGSVDPRDAAFQPGWAGPSPARWAARLRLDEPVARSVVCAAVREVFEESGVLLAGPDASTVVGDVSGPDWEEARLALIARELGFAEFLGGRGLVLRSDLLVPWSRWITPEFEPRRFDTYFFLALLPRGQVPRDVSGEADDTVWCPPAEAADGRYAMMTPTLSTLRDLAKAGGIDGVLAAAPTRDPADAIRPIAGQPKRPVM
ncbi:NUDIX hydrolase [Dactylosporangium sp. NPDC051484]|uniref:NUDIX hydrolase n=1 Tax=Dactylosporangium sp. NPDC051484 TaxID=3154942 RepID=UPI0034503D3B